MSTDVRSKLIRFLTVLGDLAAVFLSIFFSFRLAGTNDAIHMMPLGYCAAFSIAIIFNFIMLDLYSLKAENIYNALISTGIAVIIAYVTIYVLSRILRYEQQPIGFWVYLFLILTSSELAWRLVVTVAKKKIGKKGRCL